MRSSEDARKPVLLLVSLFLAGLLVSGLLLGMLLGKQTILKPISGGKVEPANAPLINPLKNSYIPLEGPWIVAIQPGHWKVEELPDELRRLRNSTGAEYDGLKEADINLRIAQLLVELVKAEGWTALLVPATVPPGLQADAFISIHADYGNGVHREGFKLSPPFRPSPASRRLATALETAFLQAAAEQKRPNGLSSIPQREHGSLAPDLWGSMGPPPKSPTLATVNMRGYFGFNYRRFEHSMSPYTPAVLIELGYLTNPTDRMRLTQFPAGYAKIILEGLRNYFREHHQRNEAFLTPPHYPWVEVTLPLAADSNGGKGAPVRVSPDPTGSLLWTLEPGTILLPVDEAGEWYEVFIRAKFATGWIRKVDTRPTTDPRWPLPGEVPNPSSSTAQ